MLPVEASFSSSADSEGRYALQVDDGHGVDILNTDVTVAAVVSSYFNGNVQVDRLRSQSRLSHGDTSRPTRVVYY